MSRHTLVLSIALALSPLTAKAQSVPLREPVPSATTDEATLAALREQIAALSQQLAIVERRLDVAQEVAATAAPITPIVAFGEKGLSVKNPAGDYEVKLRGVVHFDQRTFINDERAPLPDGLLFRRVRPTLEGNLGPLVSYRITPELANDSTALLDAWIDLRFNPGYTVRVGKQKGPVGLERLQSASALQFAERGYPTELAPNRDVGVQLQGEILKGEATYAVGVFNGTPDGRDSPAANADDHYELAGRVFFEPWRNDANALSGLGFGLAATRGQKSGGGTNLLPRYRTPGQNIFFNYRANVIADGTQERLSPQFYFYRQRLGLVGEWIRSSQELVLPGATPRRATLDNTGLQLSATWFLTGEDATYRGLAKPNSPFAIGGDGWGAFELLARVGGLRIDREAFPVFASADSAAADARSWTLGLNWYLNAHAKFLFNYSQTQFDGGALANADREDEKVFISRLQLAF